MGIKDQSVNVFSGIRGIVYLLVAIIALIPTYQIAKGIAELGGSTLYAWTSAIVFWLIAFTVVYMGTEWVMKGKTEDGGRFNILEGRR